MWPVGRGASAPPSGRPDGPWSALGPAGFSRSGPGPGRGPGGHGEGPPSRGFGGFPPEIF